jgi:CBS domain-containing protein
MNTKGDRARDLCSDNVVTVDAEQRLRDVVSVLNESNATHCAVIDAVRGLLGIVRVSDAAARSGDRIFADLLLEPAPLDVQEDLDASTVLQLMDTRKAQEIVVLSASRKYVGLITRHSLVTWRMARR